LSSHPINGCSLQKATKQVNPDRNSTNCCCSNSRQFALKLASRFVRNMQHKNILLQYWAFDMFPQSITELANKKTDIYVRVVFSEKSGRMYILPSTTFVVLWRVSLLCWFLEG
jgi:hypothetical protein